MDSNILKTKSIEQLVGDVERGTKALRRTLTAFDLTLLGIGAIIGTGIFVLTGTAAANQAGPGIMLSYVAAGLACAFAALCYAEFAAMIPIAGSAYTYSYAKLAAVLFFIIIGMGYVTPEHWTPFMPYGWAGVMAAGGVVFFAYIGFDAVSTTAEEAKNPSRDLPVGIIASLIICTVLYLSVAAILSGILPVTQYKADAR